MSEKNTRDKILHCFLALQTNKNAKDFQLFYQLSSTQLFANIMRILRNKEQAEDCLQEVYLKIWQKLDTYQPEKAMLSTWLATIARNQAIDIIRKRKIIADDSVEIETIDDMATNTLLTLEQQADDKRLQYCLKQLRSEIMEILLLSYFHGLTYEKIAKKLNKPLSTIKAQARRSLPILKHCMELKK